MYCKNCGKEIADGSTFCPYCGATQTASGSREKKTVPVRTIGIALLALVVVGGLLFFFMSKRLGFDDLIVAEPNGYDGYGYIGWGLKPDGKLYKRFEKASENYFSSCVYPEESSQCQKWYDEFNKASEIFSSIECSLTKDSYIANGDKVHIGCRVNEEKIREMGYTPGNFSKDITVSGLRPVEEIDLFDGVRFEWAYQDGYYVLNQITSEERLQYLTYHVGAIDQEGYADVFVEEDDETLASYGIKPKDGTKSTFMYVGKAPELVTYPANAEEEAFIKEKADKKMDALCTKCGWELYKTSNTKYLISSYTFNRFQDNRYGVIAVYDVSTANGSYTKEVYFPEIFRMPDGSLEDHEEFIAEDYGCSISGSYWNY